MSPQADYVVSNGTGAAVRSDINGQLAAIVSNNSGASEPGTMYAYQWWPDTTTGLLKQRNAANSAWITIGTLASANLGLLSLAGGTMTGALAVTAGTAALPGIAVSGDLNTGIYSPGADQLAISTGGTGRLAVDSSGRLLVGTPSGSGNNLLQVQGESGSSTGIGGIVLRRGLAPSLLSSGSIMGRIDFGPNDGGVGASIFGEGDAQQGTSDYPSKLVFSTTADGASSPTERMRITSQGWLKASNNGTYTYAQSMHEVRTNTNDFGFTVTSSNATPSGVQIYHITDVNGTSNQFLMCYAGIATRAEIRSNGGLANYSANNANLSDRNVKKDITPAAGTWDCIREWEIVNYRYKDQSDNADLSLGVIAQQVAESCPEVITIFQEAKDATEDKPAQEERLGVREQQMYWMAIKALQEAMERIEQLETEMAAVKAQLS